mgnify:FL=1
MHNHYVAGDRSWYMATATNSVEPNRCPFCERPIGSAGAGFMEHIESHPECSKAFELWRERVDGDMPGGWAG